MGRVLLNICGPISIYSYGATIAIGALIFIWFVQKDERFNQLQLQSRFSEIFFIGLLSAIMGGRIFHVLGSSEPCGNWLQLIAFWEPGFSILGSIIGVLCIVPMYLQHMRIPIVRFFDLIATYAGLLQGISRLGCFFAGCCFGCETSVPWSVQYTDPDSMAPLYRYLHPTQIYSALTLIAIFMFMYFIARKYLHIPGQQLAIYLALVCLERFIVDILRGDREFVYGSTFISFHQLVALCLLISAALYGAYVTLRGQYASKS